MDSFHLYKDIKDRTDGEIYIGVVGPVRCGKSTFIKRFMETLVIPTMTDENKIARTKDELPQSSDGKTGSICWYITDTDANWKKKYKTAEYKAGPKAPLSPEITGIFPDTKLEIAAVIASHCTMMFGTNTRTNPIKISTLKVDAHFLTTLVPKSAITKINAAMINVHTQYGIPNSI